MAVRVDILDFTTSIVDQLDIVADEYTCSLELSFTGFKRLAIRARRAPPEGVVARSPTPFVYYALDARGPTAHLDARAIASKS